MADPTLESIHKEIEGLDRVTAERTHDLEKRMDTIFEEQRRGTLLAEQEREKSANALRGEQQRAMEQAEREREKAAVQLRLNLEQMIHEGDVNLRAHIEEQIVSVRAALEAQEKLALERDKRFEAVHAASQEAIQKATDALDQRIGLLNEFRAQSADRDRMFPHREVVEAQFQQAHENAERLGERISALELRESRVQGGAVAEQSAQQQGAVTLAQVIGVVTVIVAVAAILVGAFT